MRGLVVPALSSLLIGCASADPPVSTVAVDPCQQAVDARFATAIVAPARGSTGLCNVDGAMTLCRRAVGTPDGPSPSMRPLSAHEEDRRSLLEACRGANGTAP